MLDINDLVLISVGVVLVHMLLYYLYSQIIKNAAIIDIGWGVGFVLIATSLLMVQESSQIQKFVAALSIIWGVRLATHIYFRNIKRPEDWRYANWRQSWGKNYWWRALLQINLLQGLMMIIIAAPIIVSANSDMEMYTQAYVGGLIWYIGFIFESVGDWQLKQFIKNKKRKGQIMTSGLWKYTRHPNYFGEVTQWWGLFIVVAPLEYGLWAIISPITITFLLLKVSGITMLEKKYEGNKEFEDYKSRTSAFFPFPPKPKAD